jgi:hypothetical protein
MPALLTRICTGPNLASAWATTFASRPRCPRHNEKRILAQFGLKRGTCVLVDVGENGFGAFLDKAAGVFGAHACAAPVMMATLPCKRPTNLSIMPDNIYAGQYPINFRHNGAFSRKIQHQMIFPKNRRKKLSSLGALH